MTLRTIQIELDGTGTKVRLAGSPLDLSLAILAFAETKLLRVMDCHTGSVLLVGLQPDLDEVNAFFYPCPEEMERAAEEAAEEANIGQSFFQPVT